MVAVVVVVGVAVAVGVVVVVAVAVAVGVAVVVAVAVAVGVAVAVAVGVVVAVVVAVAVGVVLGTTPVRIYELNHDGGLIGQALRARREAEAPRQGLHCSTIIADILDQSDPKRIARIKREAAGHEPDIDHTTMLRFQEIGNLLETTLSVELAKSIRGWSKPAPGVHRGISYSPDGKRPRSRAIDEIKACWVTARGFVTCDEATRDVIAMSMKLYGYVLQILFYMEAEDCDRGYLHVLFVNGDYRPPFPRSHTYIIKPTRRERRENADMIVQHAKDRNWL